MAKRHGFRVGEWEAHSWTYGKAGKTVLFIPGWSAPGAAFKSIARHKVLRARRVNVVLATVPGCDGTRRGRYRGFAALGGTLGDLADTVKADMVVGHSLGGSIAIEFAYASDFEGPLLLLGTPFTPQGDDAWMRRLIEHGVKRRTIFAGLIHLSRALVRAPAGMQQEIADRLPEPLRRLPMKYARALARSDADDLAELWKLHDRYLEASPSQLKRLCTSGNQAFILNGEDDADETDGVKNGWHACPTITELPELKDAGHQLFSMPSGRIARTILAILDGHAR